MRTFSSILLAAVLGCGMVTLAAGPVFAKAASGAVKKCDKVGKVCTTGKDCKKENCKNK
jgi:hypothetical protein